MIRTRNLWIVVVMMLVACVEAGATDPDPEVEPDDTIAYTHDLYVSSRNSNSVKRYQGVTGDYLGDFVLPGAGGLSATQEVAFGYDGHLYVSGRGNDAILKYDKTTGAFIGPFTSGYTLDNPTKMTFGPDSLLYVSQWTTGGANVVRFDGVTGVYVGQATDRLLINAMGHAWDDAGNLYVAVFGSQDIQVFSPGGAFREIFNKNVEGGAILGGAIDIWFGGDGFLYVSDWHFKGVRRYDLETGIILDNFINANVSLEGHTTGPDFLLYMCDRINNKINRYNPANGNLLGVFTAKGSMNTPNGLVFGPKLVD